jgi:hypothetical protein
VVLLVWVHKGKGVGSLVVVQKRNVFAFSNRIQLIVGSMEATRLEQQPWSLCVSLLYEMQLEDWLKAGPVRLGFKPVFFVFEFQWGKVVRAKRAAASWLATVLAYP